MFPQWRRLSENGSGVGREAPDDGESTGLDLGGFPGNLVDFRIPCTCQVMYKSWRWSLEVLTRLQVDPRFCHGQKEPNLLSCLQGSRRHPMSALMYIKYYQGRVRTGTFQKVGSKQKTHTYWADKSKTVVAKTHPRTQGDRKQRPSPWTPVRSQEGGRASMAAWGGEGGPSHFHLKFTECRTQGRSKSPWGIWFVSPLSSLFFPPTLFFFLFSDFFF